MQLETMQYIDSNMIDAPKWSTNFFQWVRWALCEEKLLKPDSINGQVLRFNNGHGLNALTYITLTNEKDEKVLSRVKVINQTDVEVIRDISELGTIIRIEIEHVKFEYQDHGDYQVLIDEMGFGFKEVGSGKYYFYNNVYSTTGSGINDTLFSSSFGDSAHWFVFISADSFVIMFEDKDSNGGGKAYQGFFRFNDIRDHYGIAGVAMTNAFNGIRPRYSFKVRGDGVSFETAPLLIIGGSLTERNINKPVVNRSDYELTPVYQSHSGVPVSRFMYAYDGISLVSQGDIFDLLYFGKHMVCKVRTGNKNHLIFIVGSRDGFIV